jgi:hypothetical protein
MVCDLSAVAACIRRTRYPSANSCRWELPGLARSRGRPWRRGSSSSSRPSFDALISAMRSRVSPCPRRTLPCTRRAHLSRSAFPAACRCSLVRMLFVATDQILSITQPSPACAASAVGPETSGGALLSGRGSLQSVSPPSSISRRPSACPRRTLTPTICRRIGSTIYLDLPSLRFDLFSRYRPVDAIKFECFHLFQSSESLKSG